jgi:hypothetical protein
LERFSLENLACLIIAQVFGVQDYFQHNFLNPLDITNAFNIELNTGEEYSKTDLIFIWKKKRISSSETAAALTLLDLASEISG